jgi:hypothetical protein
VAFLPGAAGTADQALVNVVVASTTASRGQAFRCAVNAESAASESPGEDLVEFGDGGTAYLGITSSRARNLVRTRLATGGRWILSVGIRPEENCGFPGLDIGAIVPQAWRK